MKRVAKAVINCGAKAYVKLNKKAIKVKIAMNTNAGFFPGTAADVAQLDTDQTLFDTLIGGAKGNTTIKAQRNEQAKLVLEDMQTLLAPVNKAAAGNTAIIALSGFDNSLDPTPQSIPNKVVIKRIVNGVSGQTGKIYIEPMGQHSLTFNVRISTVANAPVNDPSWAQVLQTTNSKNLLIPNLTRGKEVFVQVNASNAAGTGLWSETIPFILQ
jgi:hypothetical protein